MTIRNSIEKIGQITSKLTADLLPGKILRLPQVSAMKLLKF